MRISLIFDVVLVLVTGKDRSKLMIEYVCFAEAVRIHDASCGLQGGYSEESQHRLLMNLQKRFGFAVESGLTMLVR